MSEELIIRRCLKSDCPKTFRCSETREQRYCCLEHNPQGETIKASARRPHARVRMNPEKWLEMLAAIKKLLEEEPTATCGRIASDLMVKGFTHPAGGKLTEAYIGNTLHYEGLRLRKTRAKNRMDKIKALAENRNGKPAKAPIFREPREPKEQRLPDLAEAILQDAILEDSEKIDLLKTYGQID